MCVILFSPKGVEAPTEEQIKKAFARNPDGSGFAYCDNHGKVKFEKGFMCVEDLLNRLKPLEQWTNTNLAIHFRIGTAGKNDAKTCHPFPISNKFKDLQQLKGEGPVLFHNGILDKGGLADPMSSDTQDFVIAYSPMFAKYNKSKVRDSFIEDAVTGSRLLVMFDNNKVKMYGKWEKSGDGKLLVSNKLWEQEHYYSYPTYSWSGWYGRDYDTAKPATQTTTTTTQPSLTEQEIDDAFNITSSTSSPSTKSSIITPDDIAAEIKAEADKMWDKLKQEKFLWVDDYAVFEEMLDSCDELSSSYFIKDGLYYFYDDADMYIYEATKEDFPYYQ